MKDYELFSQLKIPNNFYCIIRLDGRKFHTLSKQLNLKKPYDSSFINLMGDVAYDLFKEFQPSFIYTFSDEINIILSNIPFLGRVEKIDSVLASFASSSFVLNSNKYFNISKPISFDSRVILLVKEDVYPYFKWRQDEAWRNCVNSYGINFFKNKYSSKDATLKIKGLKMADIHEILFKNNINLNNVPTPHKRGIAIYRDNDSNIFKDYEIPIFTDTFLNNFI